MEHNFIHWAYNVSKEMQHASGTACFERDDHFAERATQWQHNNAGPNDTGRRISTLSWIVSHLSSLSDPQIDQDDN